jgi:hypothetical protein
MSRGGTMIMSRGAMITSGGAIEITMTSMRRGDTRGSIKSLAPVRPFCLGWSHPLWARFFLPMGQARDRI